MSILEKALEQEKQPAAFRVRLHADRLAPHIDGATLPSRRFACVLEGLEFIAGLLLAAGLAFGAVDIVGRLLGWLWWLAEHWMVTP